MFEWFKRKKNKQEETEDTAQEAVEAVAEEATSVEVSEPAEETAKEETVSEETETAAEMQNEAADILGAAKEMQSETAEAADAAEDTAASAAEETESAEDTALKENESAKEEQSEEADVLESAEDTAASAAEETESAEDTALKENESAKEEQSEEADVLESAEDTAASAAEETESAEDTAQEEDEAAEENIKEEIVPEAELVKKKKKPGFFSKFFNNLFKDIDEDFYEELEEQLIMGDMGVYATEEILDNLRDEVTMNKSIKTSSDAKAFLIKDIKRIMTQPSDAYAFEDQKSVVILIGVNGVGKTTCVGKLTSRYMSRGKKVIMAGADTFRAAAMDQLKVWAERNGCFMVSGKEGADPGSVVYDAAKSAKARGADILICDTAGRLHNKKNLMNELGKLDKILSAEFPDFTRENIIVLDATTGQNALAQAKEFKSVMHIDGIILTKLDGTAKGGIAVAITRELGVPVKYIGVGEGINDLQRFDPDTFVEGLFAEE